MQIVESSQILNLPTRFPITADSNNSRIILFSSGEHLNEQRLIENALTTGSFAHRRYVTEEVRMIFDLLAAAVDFAVRKKQNEELVQAA